MGAVIVQYLRLGVFQFQPDGKVKLDEFLPECSRLSFPCQTDSLHGDGAASANDSTRFDIFNKCIENGNGVKSGMLVKIPVFAQDDGCSELTGDAVGLRKPPLPVCCNLPAQQLSVPVVNDCGIRIIEQRSGHKKTTAENGDCRQQEQKRYYFGFSFQCFVVSRSDAATQRLNNHISI